MVQCNMYWAHFEDITRYSVEGINQKKKCLTNFLYNYSKRGCLLQLYNDGSNGISFFTRLIYPKKNRAD